ncbi:MAG: hypothetical protein U0521_28670 [Anaerolineae bacterium]
MADPFFGKVQELIEQNTAFAMAIVVRAEKNPRRASRATKPGSPPTARSTAGSAEAARSRR